MGSPVNVGPNDPRGNVAKPTPKVPIEGGPKAEDEARGLDDPRGNEAGAVAAAAD